MNTESYGHKLKILRQGRKLTQMEVAVAVGVSRPHWTNIEKGHDPAGRETLVAAADFFGVSLDWLTQRTTQELGGEVAKMRQREAALLQAFRSMPAAEADHLLGMVLARTSSKPESPD